MLVEDVLFVSKCAAGLPIFEVSSVETLVLLPAYAMTDLVVQVTDMVLLKLLPHACSAYWLNLDSINCPNI